MIIANCQTIEKATVKPGITSRLAVPPQPLFVLLQTLNGVNIQTRSSEVNEDPSHQTPQLKRSPQREDILTKSLTMMSSNIFFCLMTAIMLQTNS